MRRRHSSLESASAIWALALLAVSVVLPGLSTAAQEAPALSSADRVRLAEAFRLAGELQDEVWSGWSQVPFAVLLVTPEHEFLIRHPRPSADFTLLAFDSLLRSDVYVRERVYAPNLLATFPAVGGLSTVVVGGPAGTDRSSTFWVITLLHEHFHQLQNHQPDYYSAVEALDLSGGDQTGMWMLNFPFPYDSSQVIRSFSGLSTSLSRTVQAAGTSDFAFRFAAYMTARQVLRDALSDEDYRYFSFQLWQEGVARYTEYRITRLAAERFRPSGAFESLEDFVPFDQAADSLYAGIVDVLTGLALDEYQRTAFYPMGAAEALLLDLVNPDWQRSYFSKKFFLEEYFEGR